jgi:transposase
MRSRRGIGRRRPGLGGYWRPKTTVLGLHPPSSVGGLGSFHEILESDQKAPKKQRHTAKRICERLKAEYGYRGGKTVVVDAVRAWRQTHQEVFLPLVHPPDEAQVDFGEATIRQGGVERKVALFVMTLPYSGAAGGGLCLRTAAELRRSRRASWTHAARRSSKAIAWRLSSSAGCRDASATPTRRSR